MGIIVQQTKEKLALDYPALNNWFPFKEGISAGTSTEIVDYAKGRAFGGGGNIVKTSPNGVIAVAGGDDYVDAAGVGTEFNVPGGTSFIAAVVADKISLPGSLIYLGRTSGLNRRIAFSEAGTARIIDADMNIYDSSAVNPSGTICLAVIFNGATGELQFYTVNIAGDYLKLGITVDASAALANGFSFGGNEVVNGISLYEGAGANEAIAYNLFTAKFTSAMPSIVTGSQLGIDLIQWRADSIAGSKGLPPFLKFLS